MNRNLKCNATSCAFNQSTQCRAGVINVRGANAISTNGTTCSSYVDRSSNSFMNTVDCGCTEPSNIRCEACNCTYNEDRNCIAENVRIDSYKACCDTFTCGKNN